MAERRMFAKSIINSARFLRMPATSRLLYYDLGMAADDDGVVEAFTVMRTTGATEDDLRVLCAKGFVTVLNSDFVTIINDWKRNNLIKNDRYRPSIYSELLVQLQATEGLPESSVLSSGTQVEPKWNPSGTQVEPQDRLGKDRLGQVRIVQDSTGEEETPPDDKRPTPSIRIPYEKVKSMYNDICKSFPKCTTLSDARKKAIRARFVAGYTINDFQTAFTKAEASPFLKGQNNRSWTATFDWMLKDANFAKILDGNYDDHHQTAEQPQRIGDLDDLF